MIRVFLFLTGVFSVIQTTLAQKPPITKESIDSWEKLFYSYKISDDGKYVWYGVSTGQVGLTRFVLFDIGKNKNDTLRKCFVSPDFSNKSHKILYKISFDSLAIRDLKSGSVQFIPKVGKHNVFSHCKSDYLAYSSGGNMVVRGLNSNLFKQYPNVSDYLISPNGNSIVAKTKEGLSLISLSEHTAKIISTGDAQNYVFDKKGEQLAFTCRDGKQNILYYYKAGMDTALKKLNSFARWSNSYEIADKGQALNFSNDGKKLYFKLSYTEKVFEDQGFVFKGVDVWHYNDCYTQIQQSRQPGSGSPEEKRFSAVIDTKPTSVPMQIENIDVALTDFNNQTADRYCMLQKIKSRPFEENFRPEWKVKRYLFDMSTGIKKELPVAYQAQISPLEKYITWFDQIKKIVFCYEISTGKIFNLSTKVPEQLFDDQSQSVETSLYDRIYFSPDESCFYLRDKFDFWKIYPKGNGQAENITNGYGRSHGIRFEVNQLTNVLNTKNEIILDGLELKTIRNGYWRLAVTKKGNKLTGFLDTCLYHGAHVAGGPQSLLRAKKNNIFLSLKQSASRSPNLYYSSDLIKFKPVSFLTPERKYNWMASEILNYKTKGGEINQAILYKPENFDPHKKYPVIFNYYQMRSEYLNFFREPALCNDEINIPWYVSRGYLVCIVDIINNEPGKIAEKVVDAVESTAEYLGKQPYVDIEKMGLNGHSFGGYETFILLANSRKFAAAQPSCGVSSLISMYSDHRVPFGGDSDIGFIENGQINMQKTLWDAPGEYIKNSPIMQAKNIVTPTLILGNKDDDDLWRQCLGMYQVMRRLNKPCWLLQYDKMDHNLDGGGAASEDFTIRQQQFFDHFLKGFPAPVWMTKGIPLRFKGIKSGLGIDTSEQMCSPNCKVCVEHKSVTQKAK